MLGYGSYHYVYASGREGDWPILGLASRKRYISLYACAPSTARFATSTGRLPKADIGKSCVRFKRLEDLDRDTLKELIEGPPRGRTYVAGHHAESAWLEP